MYDFLLLDGGFMVKHSKDLIDQVRAEIVAGVFPSLGLDTRDHSAVRKLQEAMAGLGQGRPKNALALLRKRHDEITDQRRHVKSLIRTLGG